MIVTDNYIARILANQQVSVSDVEFWHDYGHRNLGKEHNPYSKFYRDTKSGKKIMVTQGLPMVNANGDKICGNFHNETIVGWIPQNGKFLVKPNIFTGFVDGLGVELTTLNNQPTGIKKGASASWEPKLFLNGMEQSCGIVKLLDTDPTNENYHNNVLEWDYGICKRRIRIVEGRFRERWIFPANPNGDVLIKHNFSGDYKPKLGEYAVNDDEEFVPASVFNKVAYPFQVSATATYYPDAGVASVDGYALHVSAGDTWANIQGGVGTGANDTNLDSEGVVLYSNAVDWWYILRGIYLFDSSGLPDTAIISAATLSLYSSTKTDSAPWGTAVNIYSSAPALDTALAAGDYNSLGTTIFCDTEIAYASWNTGDPGTSNDFALNATGLATISKIAVSKFGLRESNFDAPNIEVLGGSGSNDRSEYYTYFTEKGAGYQPKLVVTYTLPPVPVTDGDLIGIAVIRKS